MRGRTVEVMVMVRVRNLRIKKSGSGSVDQGVMVRVRWYGSWSGFVGMES
jgi:hypothetical protein